MVAHCCHFLRGSCHFGQSCHHSHDRKAVVQQCHFGKACVNGHHGANRPANELMAQPTALAARLNGFRGIFKSDRGHDITVSWATEADGWQGAPKTGLKVLMRHDGHERQFFLRRNTNLRNYVEKGDELVCGGSTLNEAASTTNTLVWVDETGNTHYWRRQRTPEEIAREALVQRLAAAITAQGGEVLIQQLGIKIGWDKRAGHGPLQAFLQESPSLFKISDPSTPYAKVKLMEQKPFTPAASTTKSPRTSLLPPCGRLQDGLESALRQPASPSKDSRALLQEQLEERAQHQGEVKLLAPKPSAPAPSAITSPRTWLLPPGGQWQDGLESVLRQPASPSKDGRATPVSEIATSVGPGEQEQAPDQEEAAEADVHIMYDTEDGHEAALAHLYEEQSEEMPPAAEDIGAFEEELHSATNDLDCAMNEVAEELQIQGPLLMTSEPAQGARIVEAEVSASVSKAAHVAPVGPVSGVTALKMLSSWKEQGLINEAQFSQLKTFLRNEQKKKKGLSEDVQELVSMHERGELDEEEFDHFLNEAIELATYS